MDTIKILIAEDHKIVREGLRSLIEKQRPAIEVVAEASDGRSAVQLARTKHPCVVLMDVGMPGLNGIDATRQISSEHEDVKVIALSMHSQTHFVVEMFKAGATGYLLKDCAFDELIHAIRTVVAKRMYLSGKLMDVMIKDYIHLFPGKDLPASSLLSAREREVLQLLVEGKGTREIAACLKVSAKTVESNRQKIMKKLNIHNIAELTKYAIRTGITSPDS